MIRLTLIAALLLSGCVSVCTGSAGVMNCRIVPVHFYTE
jgi:uncharacterized protein YceK